jgi:hypothetical protein
LLPQNVVATKIVVLKAHLDSGKAMLQGENLKKSLFARRGFLGPKSEEIQLLDCEKSYEPYLFISGEYSIDYYKKNIYTIEVTGQTNEISIEGKQFSVPPSKPGYSSRRIVQLVDRESAYHNRSTYFILDKLRRIVSPEEIPLAPHELNSEIPEGANLNLEVFEGSMDADIDFLKKRIANRPTDVAKVRKEIFAVTERMIVCCPVYALTFQNTKTATDVVLQINGVSGKMNLLEFKKLSQKGSTAKSVPVVQPKYSMKQPKYLPNESKLVEEKSNSIIILENSPATGVNRPQSPASFKEVIIADFSAKVKGEIFTVGDNVTVVVGDLQIPSGTDVNELLVVKGNLKVGDNCRMSRKLKALGDIIVGSGVVIGAGMVAGGNVNVGSHCIIRGSIQSKGKISIPNGVVFGDEYSAAAVAENESPHEEFFVMTEPEKNTPVESVEG